MKNGPIYSNISNINRSFRTFGSPLHIDLIIDYVRTHWENGRGTTIENARDLVKRPLEAQFYYNKCEEEDHFERTEVICEKLNDLFQDMRWNPNPFLYSSKAISASMKDIYLDPRFDTISSDDGAFYLILSEWNLLNDLVIKHMVENNIPSMSMSELFREILTTYKIDDPNAYFFPKIDIRFKVDRKNTITIFNQESSEELSGQITDNIRENVAIHMPAIKNLLINEGMPISIREILQKFFAIQPHFPLFNSYFQAVKQSLSLVNNIFLINGNSLMIATENALPEKIKVNTNSTDFSELSHIVSTNLAHFSESRYSDNDDYQTKPLEQTAVKEKQTLNYSLRYFDRIQETLPAHYFKDWLVDNYMRVLFIDVNDQEYPFIFQYDQNQNILFGDHLSNFMIDYDLEPGQKLEFEKKAETLYMKLGVFDEKAHTEQMKYEDIARLAEIKHYGKKSLMQNLAELLMLHPSGLHIRQIILDIKEETSYIESSIRGTLSSYPFFETIPGKIGYWRFNPRQWKKKYMDISSDTVLPKTEKTLKVAKNEEVLPLTMLLKRKAYSTRHTKRRLTNHQYKILPKKTFIEMAWEYYSFTIYQFAKNYSSPTLPLVDLYQEAYFSLNRAYEKYKPEKGHSFYHYFKRHLSAKVRRYKIDHTLLIRIPVHRMEELYKIDKEIEERILLENPVPIEHFEFFDYTLSQSNYISFEELFLKDSVMEDDEWNAKIFSFFNNPIYHNQFLDRKLMDFIEVEEPDRCEMLMEENRFEEIILNKALVNNALKFLKSEIRNKRDYEILIYLYGFNTGDKMTLQEVGDIFNITRERVRQIDLKCLNILKRYKGFKEANHDL